ncbi:MAG: hypothetical protein LBH01_01130 [Verrucomicrobiales bacterium]|jgi:hypothetical protein|nr:hypothetical protein [Verrucomicrobiales bacterium]
MGVKIKSNGKNKMSKYITVMLAGFFVVLGDSGYSGILEVTTTPSLSGSVPDQYLAISKYKAGGNGVVFNCTATPEKGSVTAYQWNFTNGSPDTSSKQNAGKVTFSGSSAYGNSNSCTIGVTHEDSGTTCASKSTPILTVKINVVKPELNFRTSGGFSNDNTALASAQASVQGNFTMGQINFVTQAGDTYASCPYEYKYTIAAPSNSGALSTDMAIYERATFVEDYYKGNEKKSTASNGPVSGIYNPNGYYSYANANSAPANPTMYAVDWPRFEKNLRQNEMKSNKYNKFVGTIRLTSYPLFQDSTALYLDFVESEKKSHDFVITCVSGNDDGSGPYTWSCSY